MSERKRAERELRITALWMVLVVLALSAATWAWFSFNDSTNIEPMGSTVTDSSMNLLISNSRNGKYDTSCRLVYNSGLDELKPVSTADLKSFYRGVLQDANGITRSYANDTANIDKKAIHGKVYLKCDGPCDVYLDKGSFRVGGDAQIMSAGRLGIRITTKSGVSAYIYALDSMGNTSQAKSRRTVPYANVVVGSIRNGGSPNYVKNPATGPERFYAGGSERKPTAGKQRVCVLRKDEIATVEYWLYLEGCDDNCYNPVQNREITLKLGFAGIARED